MERLGRLFGVGFVACVGCAMTLDKNDAENFVKCENPGCKGEWRVWRVQQRHIRYVSYVVPGYVVWWCCVLAAVYCRGCFAEMNNMCTACLKPIDYGDMSDVSQEL